MANCKTHWKTKKIANQSLSFRNVIIKREIAIFKAGFSKVNKFGLSCIWKMGFDILSYFCCYFVFAVAVF